MARCKDCLHYEVCEARITADENYPERKYTENNNCCNFKDCNRFVELPCKIGETVFVLDDMGDEEYLVASCTISAIRYECKETDSKIIIMTEGSLGPFTNSWVLGKTAFLSKEEAEQALKEIENNG